MTHNFQQKHPAQLCIAQYWENKVKFIFWVRKCRKNKNCSLASCINVLGCQCLVSKGAEKNFKKTKKCKRLSKVKYALEMNWRYLSYLQKKGRLLCNGIQDTNAAVTYSVDLNFESCLEFYPVAFQWPCKHFFPLDQSKMFENLVCIVPHWAMGTGPRQR